MKFVFPKEEHEAKACAYVQEFRDHASQINGTGGLNRYLIQSTYAQWLEKVRAEVDIANVPEGKVPSFTYFYMRETDEKIVGMMNIRLALNDFLRKDGGHIGYSIRPTERRKGYATGMLQAAIQMCHGIGLNALLISCVSDNPASAGVIMKCGGILEEEFYSIAFGEMIQRYRIDYAE